MLLQKALISISYVENEWNQSIGLSFKMHNTFELHFFNLCSNEKDTPRKYKKVDFIEVVSLFHLNHVEVLSSISNITAEK